MAAEAKFEGSAETRAVKPPVELHRKHSLAVRWFHWLNFPLLFLMI